jgi:uncharacterized membrane protein YciS (DUF1049 family)
MTFDERASAYGYNKIDQNFFKRDNGHYKVAGLCVVVLIVGFCVHWSIAMMSYEKHSRELGKLHSKLYQIEVDAKAKAQASGLTGNPALRSYIMKHDNEAGDRLREFDEQHQKRMMKKLEDKEKIILFE